MSAAQVWWAFLVVGQGVIVGAVIFVVIPKLRAIIEELRKLAPLLGLIFDQTNEAVIELQRSRGLLKFKKPEPPDDPDPTFI